MTEYKLTEADRRLTTPNKQWLTEELLGECWHDICYDCAGEWCSKCGAGRPKNRTFTTAQDMMDVRKALRESGKWREFYWCDAVEEAFDRTGFDDSDRMAYLDSDIERFCKLVCLWGGENDLSNCCKRDAL